jgi:hypothetical protein
MFDLYRSEQERKGEFPIDQTAPEVIILQEA